MAFHRISKDSAGQAPPPSVYIGDDTEGHASQGGHGIQPAANREAERGRSGASASRSSSAATD